MNLYKKQMKPFVNPPALQGFNGNPYPLKEYDWIDEDKITEELLNEWNEKAIKAEGGWSSLITKERFVPYEFDG